ncbi:hypothetical protein ES708_19227 [subsurface metagenome]
MLVRSGGVSIPRVIGYIDEKSCALQAMFATDFREYHLIADKGPYHFVTHRKGRNLVTRLKIPGTHNQLIDKEEDPAHGDIFTEGDQVHLVISPGDEPVRRQQVGAVVKGDILPFPVVGRRSEQEPGPCFPCYIYNAPGPLIIVLKVEWRCRFGPDDQRHAPP